MASEQIKDQTEQTTIGTADQFLLQETASPYTCKRALWSTMWAGVFSKIASLTQKTAVALTDKLVIQESGGTNKYALVSALIDAVYPVGCFYVQYPDAASNTDAIAFPTAYRPETLFGGTWVEQFNTEATFFRTGGTDGQTRTNGLSADQFQGHRQDASSVAGFSNFASGASGGSMAISTPGGVYQIWSSQTGSPVSDGTNGTPRTGTKTEPINRLMKVWKRTA